MFEFPISPHVYFQQRGLSHDGCYVIMIEEVTKMKIPGEVRTRLNINGRLVIPASIRQELDLKPGDEILLFVENDELRLTSARKRAERAQKLFKRYVGEGVSLSEELIADRRKEAAPGE